MFRTAFVAAALALSAGPAFAIISHNALDTNGLGVNAIAMNGYGANALTQNGFSGNGYGANALTENALTENGTAPTAIRAPAALSITLPSGLVLR